MQDRLSIPCQSTNHKIRSRQMPLSEPQFLFCLSKEDILKPKVIILINNLTIYSSMVGHSYHAFKVSASGKSLRILKVNYLIIRVAFLLYISALKNVNFILCTERIYFSFRYNTNYCVAKIVTKP